MGYTWIVIVLVVALLVLLARLEAVHYNQLVLGAPGSTACKEKLQNQGKTMAQ